MSLTFLSHAGLGKPNMAVWNLQHSKDHRTPADMQGYDTHTGLSSKGTHGHGDTHTQRCAWMDFCF